MRILIAGILAALPAALDAQNVSAKCEGNLLVTALPQSITIDGYKATDVDCARGHASKTFRAGDSEVTVSLQDALGELAGTAEANHPQQIRAMARDMGTRIVHGVTENVAAGKAVIEALQRNPQSIEIRGGPNYMPFTLPMGGNGEILVLAPPVQEAHGDFQGQGVYRGRYMVAIDVKQARAGKDALAGRATIVPFLAAMNFSKLPP